MAYDLIERIQETSELLNTAVRLLKKRGMEYAGAERDYKIALNKKILLERENGTPVTIMSDICRGSEEIAQLRFKRDCAEVVYKSAQEAINSYKLQLRLLDAQLDREWSHAARD